MPYAYDVMPHHAGAYGDTGAVGRVHVLGTIPIPLCGVA